MRGKEQLSTIRDVAGTNGFAVRDHGCNIAVFTDGDGVVITVLFNIFGKVVAGVLTVDDDVRAEVGGCLTQVLSLFTGKFWEEVAS